jgi:F-type H+-transporting ATPase subunit epsilon
MSALGLGEVLIYQNSSEPLSLFVDGGILQVQQNKVELLANVAEKAEELDAAKIEEARRKAEKLIQERPIDIDLAKVESALQRELMKQKLVNKHRRLY